MSAANPRTAKSADGVYRFRMERPMPSYLLALAVGDLAFRALGPAHRRLRRALRASSCAAWELADTEKMVARGREALRALPVGTLRPARPAAVASRSAAWRIRASPSRRRRSSPATARW